MKAKKIYYKKLFSLGNYENEEVGVELEIESGETASQVLEAAKQFVNGLNPANKKVEEYNNALKVLKEKDGYNYRRVMEAQAIVTAYQESEHETEDLPF